MGLFHKYLTYSNDLLTTDDDDEAGPLEKVKAGICELLQLFTHKYEDVFEEMLQNFVNSTWELLTNLGPQPKYDIVSIRSEFDLNHGGICADCKKKKKTNSWLAKRCNS